jgi:hypothetical protein
VQMCRSSARANFCVGSQTARRAMSVMGFAETTRRRCI